MFPIKYEHFSIAHRLFLIWPLYTFFSVTLFWPTFLYCTKLLGASGLPCSFKLLDFSTCSSWSSNSPLHSSDWLIPVCRQGFSHVLTYLRNPSLIPIVLVRYCSFVCPCMVLSCLVVVFVLYRICLLSTS